MKELEFAAPSALVKLWNGRAAGLVRSVVDPGGASPEESLARIFGPPVLASHVVLLDRGVGEQAPRLDWPVFADGDAVLDRYRHGATVRVLSADATDKICGSMVELVGKALRQTGLTSNAYITPKGSAGSVAHVDEHDVLVVQMAGRKHWRVDGIGEVCLESGDVLLIPADTTHYAWTTDASSFHLSLSQRGDVA